MQHFFILLASATSNIQTLKVGRLEIIIRTLRISYSCHITFSCGPCVRAQYWLTFATTVEPSQADHLYSLARLHTVGSSFYFCYFILKSLNFWMDCSKFIDHRAYPVTQECAIIVKVTPNLCNAIAKTSSTVRKRTKIFYSKSNLKKWISAYGCYDIIHKPAFQFFSGICLLSWIIREKDNLITVLKVSFVFRQIKMYI
jgi:hypothetical protein